MNSIFSSVRDFSSFFNTHMTRHVSYSTIIICSAVYLIVGDLSWPYFIYCLIVLFLGIGWMVMTLVRRAKTLTVDRKEP